MRNAGLGSKALLLGAAATLASGCSTLPKSDYDDASMGPKNAAGEVTPQQGNTATERWYEKIAFNVAGQKVTWGVVAAVPLVAGVKAAVDNHNKGGSDDGKICVSECKGDDAE